MNTIILVLSLAPLAFLTYTLLNLGSLGIRVTHPRVIVELFIFLVLLVLGLVV